MRVSSILSLALMFVFRPCSSDQELLTCLGSPGWSRPYPNVALSASGAESCKSQCLAGGYLYWGLECPMTDDVHCQCSSALGGTVLDASYCEGNGDGNGNLYSGHAHCVGPYEAGGYLFGDANVGSVYATETTDPTALPSSNPTTASPTELDRDCDEFNIDGFLSECSADFPAEQEALVAVEARVSTLESDTTTSDSLAETLAAVEAVTADLSAYETATNANLTATDANLAATDVAVGEVSIRVNSIEETLSGFSSARMETAQFDTLPTNTGASLLFGDKDLLIVISLAVNTVLLTALLAVLCRSGKDYKAVGTFAQSDSEMAELQ